MLTRAVFIVVLSSAPAFVLGSAPALALELSQPIDCTPGTDCFIQQYVDHDEGAEAQDYACGAETYDGHKGTDIRLRSTADVEKGVAVKASADGTVIGLRDGEEDHLVRTNADRAAIKDRECGNGVLLDHGEGWRTQYCHMRKGSVAVQKGDHVAAGAKLGEVGYSGDAAFAHVHLQVTKDDKIVDPFLAEDKAACTKDGPSLWSEAAKAAFPYRQGELIGFGLIDRPPVLENLEEGAHLRPPDPDTPMVAYLWAINLQKGDVVTIELRQGGTVLATNSSILDHSKAQMMLFAGQKVPPSGWPKGSYQAAAKVTRGGKEAISETKTLELK